ncbi:hypothetical protein JCM10908_003013 [Rhodotorula pacifica]|uniref:uncharacterized protein n=1 Tax=Rhodotorula pacifica TaxID=1495444 RepID=UPI003176FF29
MLLLALSPFLLALAVSITASPLPQAIPFNPANAIPAIPGVPKLDTAGWSLESGTAISSASNPSSTAQNEAGPVSNTDVSPTTTSIFTPAAGPGISAAVVSPPAFVNATATGATTQPEAPFATSSSLTPFTTLSNNPAAAATAPPDQAGALSPTPTLQGNPSSTLATLDPSAASAMADILSGIAALQDSTGLEEGATSKEDPSAKGKAAQANPPAPQPASVASA